MIEDESGPIRIEVTFQRIQTFLFAIPRLRAMLGANASLGELIRNKLRQSLLEQSKGTPSDVLTVTLEFKFALEAHLAPVRSMTRPAAKN